MNPADDNVYTQTLVKSFASLFALEVMMDATGNILAQQINTGSWKTIKVAKDTQKGM